MLARPATTLYVRYKKQKYNTLIIIRQNTTTMAKITKEDALNYHAGKRPGKIEVVPTKPYFTQTDLSLALRVLLNPVSRLRRIPTMHINIPIRAILLL